MSAVTIQQMADRIAGLMEERLGIRGKGLTEKLRRGKRALPRTVRAAAQDLADLAERAQNPKLLAQMDQGRVAANYDICLKHLMAIKPGAARLTALLRVLATVAFGLLLLGAAVLAIQHLQGRI